MGCQQSKKRIPGFICKRDLKPLPLGGECQLWEVAKGNVGNSHG